MLWLKTQERSGELSGCFKTRDYVGRIDVNSHLCCFCHRYWADEIFPRLFKVGDKVSNNCVYFTWSWKSYFSQSIKDDEVWKNRKQELFKLPIVLFYTDKVRRKGNAQLFWCKFPRLLWPKLEVGLLQLFREIFLPPAFPFPDMRNEGIKKNIVYVLQ